MNYITRPWASDEGNTRQFTNYVTRPWASDKGDTRQITNYITRPWASDKGDLRTYKEIQLQVFPRNCITRTWASDIVKRKLVTRCQTEVSD